jgi:hypothetical protein
MNPGLFMECVMVACLITAAFFLVAGMSKAWLYLAWVLIVVNALLAIGSVAFLTIDATTKRPENGPRRDVWERKFR